MGINIEAVVRFQTCISLLLNPPDRDPARQALISLKPRPLPKFDRLEDVVMIRIVGDGNHRRKGIAALCFPAVALGRSMLK
jgi:hypothetical protein